jgi:hypothetical protein
MTEILVGLDRSTAWLGAARIISRLASASRQQNAEREMSSSRTWRILPESHRIARESIEAISRLRQAPSLSVERSEVIGVVLIPMGDR